MRFLTHLLQTGLALFGQHTQAAAVAAQDTAAVVAGPSIPANTATLRQHACPIPQHVRSQRQRRQQRRRVGQY